MKDISVNPYRAGGFAACKETLAWFEDGIRYDIEAFLEQALRRGCWLRFQIV